MLLINLVTPPQRLVLCLLRVQVISPLSHSHATSTHAMQLLPTYVGEVPDAETVKIRVGHSFIIYHYIGVYIIRHCSVKHT